MALPRLVIIEEQFSLHHLEAKADLNSEVLTSAPVFISRSDKELSVLALSAIPLESESCTRGWRCIEVQGPLDLDALGILAGMTAVLAEAGVPVLANSTYLTDYIFVPGEKLAAARSALEAGGYEFD